MGRENQATGLTKLAVALVVAGGCGADYHVRPPRREPVVRPMVHGGHDGVRVPEGMRIIAAYGDDT